MSTDHHRFYASLTPDTFTEGLADLGIVMRPPEAQRSYWPDDAGAWWKEIGRITVCGPTIELWPYRGINDTDLDVLRGAGFEVTYTPPSHKNHWAQRTSRTRGRYWECVISRGAGASDSTLRGLWHAYDFCTRQARAARARFDTFTAA